ncbi:MAG: GCN5-related N-acetyltransferase [Chlorobi bacterium]|nr:GCN5-related N-acetyltransferase [Chlorobiota bacterium]
MQTEALNSSHENAPDSATIRHAIRPGDIGSIVHLHGILYAREYNFDATFEAYVAGPLAEFVISGTDRDRIWIAERNGRLAGCIAIVAASTDQAQLRWFLVDPSARGLGLGKRLLGDAVAFCRERNYRSIILWTVGALTTAGGLYRAAGFHKTEQHATHQWGVDVVEEKYEMSLEDGQQDFPAGRII